MTGLPPCSISNMLVLGWARVCPYSGWSREFEEGKEFVN